MHVAIARFQQLLVLLGEQCREELRRQRVARLHAALIVGAERRILVQPFPQDAQADLAGGHVLHQVEDVVVAEEVRRLERRRLQSLAEGVAVLQRDADQIARAADRSGATVPAGRGLRRLPPCR